MKKNTSPWLAQLNPERSICKLSRDIGIDYAIVGAGIAGISTAFFLLKNTNKGVAILEKDRIASGATGHNAGQIVSYFERPFVEIVEEFGLEKACDGLKSVESAWSLFDEMYTDANLDIPFSRFTGFTGLSKKEQVYGMLADGALIKKGGLTGEEMFISDTADFLDEIPAEYSNLFKIIPHSEVLKKLETANTDFIACMSKQKGVVNSALFCQEVISFLLKKYPDRFIIFEDTQIHKIALHDDMAILDAGESTVHAERVMLCTNGFENLNILNKSGLDIDDKFHHNINGVVGYMSGYLEKMNKQPTAISYLFDKKNIRQGAETGDPYFYLTRRPFEKEKNLISIGGPEFPLEDRKKYKRDYEFPKEAEKEIDNFVKSTYDSEPNRKIDYIFTWHGLMGYTPNRIRRIGFEPKNKVLLYNLGCNGVGILPSIYGGSRISHLLNGENLGESIFDPK